MTTPRIDANKFNEITYAIGQLESIIGYGDEARNRVYTHYSPEVVAAYEARCAEIDAEDAAASDTPGTF